MTLHNAGNVSCVMPIPSVVVDGNQCSRTALCSILDRDPEISFLGQFETEKEVFAILQEHPRVLLFMDVQMPRLDCFQLLRHLGSAPPPTVILIASDTRYVMEALQLHVFGYLLRPVSESLVRANLEAAKRHLEYGRVSNSLFPLRAAGVVTSSERLVIKSRGRFIFLRSGEIDWIEAKGNYVRIHAGPTSFIERKTMASLEAQLDPTNFARIHKSTIVNLDKIRELRVWPTGEYVVFMRNGKELTLTRYYRERLAGLLGRRRISERPADKPLCLQG
jgi:two-component system, LytTR family, response regulator